MPFADYSHHGFVKSNDSKLIPITIIIMKKILLLFTFATALSACLGTNGNKDLTKIESKGRDHICVKYISPDKSLNHFDVHSRNVKKIITEFDYAEDIRFAMVNSIWFSIKYSLGNKMMSSYGKNKESFLDIRFLKDDSFVSESELDGVSFNVKGKTIKNKLFFTTEGIIITTIKGKVEKKYSFKIDEKIFDGILIGEFSKAFN